MFMLTRKWYLMGILGIPLLTGLVSGCATIEHRSEDLQRQPLPVLSSPAFEPSVRWSSKESAGLGNFDAKLKVALTPNMIILADYTGRLFAYDKATGAQRWQVKTDMPISAGPTVSHATVYLGTREGDILAYDVNNGACLWKSSVRGEVLAAPTAGKNALFVHALDGAITALHLQDGHPMWRYGLNTPSIVLRQSSSPAVADHNIIVGFSNGKLLSFHPIDGSVNWERQLGEPQGRSDVSRMADISADPVISQGVVYAVSYHGRLAALSLETGSPIWQRTISSYAGLSLSSKMLYVSESDGAVRAMSRGTGDTFWKQTGLGGRRLTKPILWNDVLVVGDDEGYCHFISQQEGTFIGRIRVDSQGIDAAPIVSGDTLVVLGRSGKLVVLCK